MLTVRQLLPEPADIDPAAAHAIAARPTPTSRPWVLVNMVASVDGATAIDGVSGVAFDAENDHHIRRDFCSDNGGATVLAVV